MLERNPFEIRAHRKADWMFLGVLILCTEKWMSRVDLRDLIGCVDLICVDLETFEFIPCQAWAEIQERLLNGCNWRSDMSVLQLSVLAWRRLLHHCGAVFSSQAFDLPHEAWLDPLAISRWRRELWWSPVTPKDNLEAGMNLSVYFRYENCNPFMLRAASSCWFLTIRTCCDPQIVRIQAFGDVGRSRANVLQGCKCHQNTWVVVIREDFVC